MGLRVFFTAVVALLLFLPLAYAGGPKPRIRFASIEPAGSTAQYTAAIVSAFPSEGDLEQGSESFLNLANNWYLDLWLRSYLKSVKAGKIAANEAEIEKVKIRIQQMRKAGIKLGTSDSMVIIFKGNDPTQIVSTLRWSHPDEEGRLALEKALQLRYPHPPLDIRKQSVLVHSTEAGKELSVYEFNAFSQGAVELKTLGVLESETIDWVPIMQYIGEIEDLGSRDTIVELKDPALRNKVRQLMDERLPSSLSKAQPTGIHLTTFPAEYAIESYPYLVSNYQAKGFELVNGEVTSEGTQLMHQTRAQYTHAAAEGLAKTKGFQLLNAASVKIPSSQSKSCIEDVLKDVLPDGTVARSSSD